MVCSLLSTKGGKQLLSFQAQPVCAVDYCDRCGKCLVCDAAEPCLGHSSHHWIIYVDGVTKFLDQHNQVPAALGQAS